MGKARLNVKMEKAHIRRKRKSRVQGSTTLSTADAAAAAAPLASSAAG